MTDRLYLERLPGGVEAGNMRDAVKIVRAAATKVKMAGELLCEFLPADGTIKERGPWDRLELRLRSAKIGTSVAETITHMPTDDEAAKILRRLNRRIKTVAREQAERRAAWNGMDH